MLVGSWDQRKDRRWRKAGRKGWNENSCLDYSSSICGFHPLLLSLFKGHRAIVTDLSLYMTAICHWSRISDRLACFRITVILADGQLSFIGNQHLLQNCRKLGTAVCFLLFETGSLCSSGCFGIISVDWPRTQRSASSCLPSAGIKGLC